MFPVWISLQVTGSAQKEQPSCLYDFENHNKGRPNSKSEGSPEPLLVLMKLILENSPLPPHQERTRDSHTDLAPQGLSHSWMVGRGWTIPPLLRKIRPPTGNKKAKTKENSVAIFSVTGRVTSPLSRGHSRGQSSQLGFRKSHLKEPRPVDNRALAVSSDFKIMWETLMADPNWWFISPLGLGSMTEWEKLSFAICVMLLFLPHNILLLNTVKLLSMF